VDWNRFDPLLDAALEEDAARHDVTTSALVGGGLETDAEVRTGGAGVVCGLPLARRLAGRFDRRLAFRPLARDGDLVGPGDVVAHLRGPAAGILSIERTMLNFLQRLSGVATLTARFVERVAGTRAGIYDTRKTTPGWRELEKYAVRCGGGQNHRMGLADMALIKDNHLALVGGDAAAAVRRVREAGSGVPIEVEVDDLDGLRAALEARPDVVMLDNMDPEQVREAVELIARSAQGGPRPRIEASGAITLANVADYAAAGVDRIAIGALTHSAPALDLLLEVAPR
jgi:nicotinate-nucleotide pyrophosphorylase (carboxylating)